MEMSKIVFGTRGVFVPAKGCSDEILAKDGLPIGIVSRIHPGGQTVAIICEVEGLGLITRNCYVYGYGGPRDARFIPDNAIVEAVNTLVSVCHGAAKEAGWWVNPKTGEDVRDNPMSFSQKLMLIVSELAEAMEGDRKSLMDDKLPHRPMREVEMADALIRIFDTCGGYDMKIGGAVAEKLAYNAQRADHKLENRMAVGGKAY